MAELVLMMVKLVAVAVPELVVLNGWCPKQNKFVSRSALGGGGGQGLLEVVSYPRLLLSINRTRDLGTMRGLCSGIRILSP